MQNGISRAAVNGRFFQDQDHHPDPEPDRGPEAVLRALPADGPAAQRARRHRAADASSSPSSRSPISAGLAAGVRRLLHRQLGVQVRQPEGAAPPARHLPEPVAAPPIITDPFHPGDVLCHKCGTFNKNIVDLLQQCGDPVGLQLKYDVSRVPGARHDLRRAAQGHHPPDDLRQGPRDRRQDHPRHQGAGSLLRRNPADDGQRHVHHQRHRARHRQPVAPLARRLLRERQQPHATSSARSSPTAALGGVRVRHTRTCCTSASTASASSWAPSSCARWG